MNPDMNVDKRRKSFRQFQRLCEYISEYLRRLGGGGKNGGNAEEKDHGSSKEVGPKQKGRNRIGCRQITGAKHKAKRIEKLMAICQHPHLEILDAAKPFQ
jgi:hypothetical protein